MGALFASSPAAGKATGAEHTLQPAKHSLLHMSSRPTIAQMERSLKPWPEKNPFPRDGFSRNLIKLVKKVGPQVIAGLERSFPGATYAFLGRDSVFVADVVDAFYRAHGQKDRVVRLNASGASLYFEDPSVEREMLVDFLATNGLRIDEVDTAPPFILLDATNYTGSSQSRRYIKAFYAAYHDLTKRSVRRLVSKFNVVDVRLTNQNAVIPGFDVEGFLKKQEKLADEYGPDEIMKVEATDLTYTEAWHDTFETMIRKPNGRVIAPPGTLAAEPIRERILSIMYDVINATRSAKFYQDVQAAARELGYRFPRDRVLNRSDLKIMSPEELSQRLLRISKLRFYRLINGLKPVGEAGEPFTSNGAQIYEHIRLSEAFDPTPGKRIRSTDLALIFLSGILHAYKTHKVNFRDLRRITKRILAFYRSDAESTSGHRKNERSFRQGILELYVTNATFRRMWNTKRDYFLNTAHQAGPFGSQVYRQTDRYVRRHLKNSCSQLFDAKGPMAKQKL